MPTNKPQTIAAFLTLLRVANGFVWSSNPISTPRRRRTALSLRDGQEEARLQRIERQPIELLRAAGEIDHPDGHVRRIDFQRFAEVHQMIDARRVDHQPT